MSERERWPGGVIANSPTSHCPPNQQDRVPHCLDPACHRPIVRDGMCSRHITLEEI